MSTELCFGNLSGKNLKKTFRILIQLKDKCQVNALRAYIRIGVQSEYFYCYLL